MNQKDHHMSGEIIYSGDQNSGITTQLKSGLHLKSEGNLKTAEMASKLITIGIFSRRRLVAFRHKIKEVSYGEA